jgi:glycosyltransferase involved in cell wall biosynthesis
VIRSRPARILTLIDRWHYGGEENRILQLARAVDRSRYDITIATLCSDDSEFDQQYGSIREEYTAAGLSVLELGVKRTTKGLGLNHPFRHVRRVTMLKEAVRRIVDRVRGEGFDLVDGHGPSGYLCGTLAARICGVPSVLTTYIAREDWSPRMVWFVAHQLTLGCVSAIVTDSDYVANRLRKWMLLNRKPRLFVIPNGPPPPQPVRSALAVRRELKLPPQGSARIIGHIATLVPGKGQNVLIDAAPEVLRSNPEAFFLIVGFERGDSLGYAGELRAQAARLGISERVVVTPYQGPIGDIWQVIDIHAHPSMLDSLPNAVLEGMSLGKPAVVTATGGIPTMVVNGRTGIVVAPGDAGALAAGLNALLGDSTLSNRLSAAARQRYLECYNEKLLAERMEHVFDTLLENRR